MCDGNYRPRHLAWIFGLALSRRLSGISAYETDRVS
jgi:hypothetical protein